MRIPREDLDNTMPIRVSNIENGQIVHQVNTLCSSSSSSTFNIPTVAIENIASQRPH